MSSETPRSPVSRSEIFREQALQAWRGQEAETRTLLDLSPRWMRWALAGIFLLAGLGVLLAATTTIPSRATSTASARLSAGGDSVFVDAVFALRDAASIRAGQTMSFRPQDPGVSAVDLTILAVAPYPAKASSEGSARRILVHGAILTNQIRGDVVTGIGAGGTAHVVIGQESLLHLFRPRTPGGVKP